MPKPAPLAPGQLRDVEGVVWDTTLSLATARGISPASVSRRLHDARVAAKARDGRWPDGHDVVPAPDGERFDGSSGMWRLVWDPSREDVETYKSRGVGKGRPQELDDREWLVEQHHTLGRTVWAIAKELGVERATVEAALERLGVEARKGPGRRPRKLPDKSLLDLWRAVLEHGGQAHAARALGVTEVTFRAAVSSAAAPTDPVEVEELARVQAAHEANVAEARRARRRAAVSG